jgi:hypothetical protein
VHPYREGEPESAADDFAKLRDLIAKYVGPGKTIPIISSEWGYSTAWKDQSPQLQADYLAREWLTNQWQHIPLSIYYDWQDDTSSIDAECHFGMVDQNLQPKSAYNAARTLIDQLRGFTFADRLNAGGSDVFLLRFTRNKHERFAVWTTRRQRINLRLAVKQTEFKVCNVTGEELPSLKAIDGAVELTVSSSPLYLTPVEK